MPIECKNNVSLNKTIKQFAYIYLKICYILRHIGLTKLDYIKNFLTNLIFFIFITSWS